MRLPIVIAASILAGTFSTAVFAQQTLQQLAEAALVAEQPDRAAALATQLLNEQPDSFAALYLLALAQADMGAPKQAIQSGARAYAVAPDENARFQAARFVASTHFAAGHFTRSAFWLRRAANHTDNPEELQSLAAAYVTTRDANPLSTQIVASVAPSDNINNGSDDGVLQFEGIDLTFVLPEDRRSLSGVAFSVSSELRYRIAENAAQTTSVIASLSGETYTLSSASRDLLDNSPDPAVRAVTGGDYATVTAALGVARVQRNLSPLGPVELGANIGSYWQGGERLLDFRDLRIQQQIPVGRSELYTVTIASRDQSARTSEFVDSTTYDLIGGYNRILANNNQLQLSLSARRQDAGTDSSYDEYRVGIGYGLARPVLGAQISTSLQLGYRTYAEFATTLNGREDRLVDVGATAVFPDLTYYGFAPSISLTASRTDSTAEENTSSSAQIVFGIESTF